MELFSSVRRRKPGKEEDNEPMDTDEQIEMIDTMQQDNNRANYFFRAGFALLTAIFGVVKVCLAVTQVLHPYSMPFHQTLEGKLGTPLIVVLEGLASISFFALALFVKPAGYRWAWKVSAIAIAIPVVFVTGAVFVYPLASLVMRIIFALWFMGLPLFLISVLRYLDGKIRESEVAIRRLYGLTYPYKKA